MRQRLAWIDRLVDQRSDGQGLNLSPQAAALFDEMRHCFASGTWLAALILAQAALDAELEQGDIDGLTQNEIRFGHDYVWMRNRRNDVLHADDPRPAVTLADLDGEAARLKRDAQRAVELLVGAIT